MRKQISQVGTSPSSGLKPDLDPETSQYKLRCEALEQQIAIMTAEFSKKLVVTQAKVTEQQAELIESKA